VPALASAGTRPWQSYSVAAELDVLDAPEPEPLDASVTATHACATAFIARFEPVRVSPGTPRAVPVEPCSSSTQRILPITHLFGEATRTLTSLSRRREAPDAATVPRPGLRIEEAALDWLARRFVPPPVPP